MLVKQDQLIEDDHEHVKEMISKLKSYANNESLFGRYSRTSVARRLMARLPRLFRTRSRVPWKK